MRSHLSQALCAAALMVMTPAAAQDGLPPAPGRAETLKACGGCHGVDSFLYIRRNQGEWETTIQNMINFGMTISDADYDAVLSYLTVYFGPAPRPKPPASSP
jgi:mono/diheme cytochrome c family protein